MKKNAFNKIMGTALATSLPFGTLMYLEKELKDSVTETKKESIQMEFPLEERLDYSEILFSSPEANNFPQNLRDSFIRYEGFSRKAYRDSLGYNTIGVGFNLDKPGAKERIESLGLNFRDVYSGKIDLTEKQIFYLLDQDIQIAKTDAERYLGKETLEKINPLAREIVLDMAFNMGYSGLSSFKKLRAALKKLDYKEAARAMENSLWYKQTGRRSKELVEKMKSLK